MGSMAAIEWHDLLLAVAEELGQQSAAQNHDVICVPANTDSLPYGTLGTSRGFLRDDLVAVIEHDSVVHLT